nr:MAG TPA: hypothetical protein [Bacteriophage sp.]
MSIISGSCDLLSSKNYISCQSFIWKISVNFITHTVILLI